MDTVKTYAECTIYMKNMPAASIFTTIGIRLKHVPQYKLDHLAQMTISGELDSEQYEECHQTGWISISAHLIDVLSQLYPSADYNVRRGTELYTIELDTPHGKTDLIMQNLQRLFGKRLSTRLAGPLTVIAV